MKHRLSLVASAFFVACSSVPTEDMIDPRAGLTEHFESSLGMSVHYPKTVSLNEACRDLTVGASEERGTIEFRTVSGPEGCDLVGNTFATIEAQRAEDEIDVRDFVGRVFSPDCLVTEQNAYELNGDEMVSMFTENRNPPADGPDFTCRTVLWNKDAGVVWYSDLGDKTGGAYDWPSHVAIKTDGGWENGWDFFVIDSIRFPR